MRNASSYERDFYAWTKNQADLLRSGRLDEADIANIAEEIESMGRSERRELISRLQVLIAHLLKWQAQPLYRGTSWILMIREQRQTIAEHLDDNPSLAAVLVSLVARAYRVAVLRAERETGLPETTFPPACPFTTAEIVADAFLPT